MITTLRILQLVVALLIIPMGAIGMMAGLSGGGDVEARQQIAATMAVNSLYIPIPAIVIAEIIYRLMRHTPLPNFYVIPVLVMLIPLGMWVNYFIQLRSTG
jgi:hypothetical protein